MTNTTFSARNGEREITLNIEVWKEGVSHIAYASDLDISSVGKTASQAKSRLREAVSLFIEEAARMGTLGAILEESGFERRGKTYRHRPVLAREKMKLALPAA
jgi:predicted RNase H-like HicB family nuclease